MAREAGPNKVGDETAYVWLQNLIFPLPARESRCLQGNDLSSARLSDSRTHEHELWNVNISCVTSLHAAVLIELYQEARYRWRVRPIR